MKRALWIDLRHVPVHKRLGHLRTLAESGAEAVLLEKGDAHHGREGLATITVDAKGGLRQAGKPIGRVVEVRDRRSQERAAKAKGILVAKPDAAAWKVIPLENLLASRAGAPVYAWTTDPKEAQLLLTVLERGVDGIVLAPQTPMDILECRAAMAHVRPVAKESAAAPPPVLPPTPAPTPGPAPSTPASAPSPGPLVAPTMEPPAALHGIPSAASVAPSVPSSPTTPVAPAVPVPAAPASAPAASPAAPAPRVLTGPLRASPGSPQRDSPDLPPPLSATPTVEAVARAAPPTTAGPLAFEAARVTRIERVGVAERVCVDATARFAPDEGLLVGSTARSFCLVLSENTQSDLVPPRPFRVNAGAVHSYVLAPGGRTSYLTELAAGSPVLAATLAGRSRELVTGRAKIEPRPHLLVAWQGPSGAGSAVLQEAETVRVATPSGPRAVTQLRVGDPLLAHPESAGRHTGLPVAGSLEER